MSRYTDSACKLCRREVTKLFLKGDRCYTEKCAMERRAYPPGPHGQSKGKDSQYAVQMREKQKIRRLYGVQEKQFRKYFKEADRLKGVTGSNLLVLLERRLDNIVYRLGFANSRAQSRQLINHGHVLVNGKRVDIASYSVENADIITVQQKSREVQKVLQALDAVERRGVPAWLQLDRAQLTGVVKSIPTREDLAMPLQEQLVVEFYSR